MNLQRLLVERIEHRILVGTVAFLAIMVLVGWIAINEGGRMQAFERQYLARSIERGAALFANNCTSCHGPDGRGLTGIAPALNSPYLFGHDFLAAIIAEADTLSAERGAESTTDARRAEIDTRLGELDAQRTSLLAQMQPAVDRGYDPEAASRLRNLGWTSTLYQFVFTTLVHGRPASSSYWPQPMAAWSQVAGGPLRSDQLDDLTNYVLNWDKGDQWTLEDLNAVNQFPIQPVDPATVVTDPNRQVVGSQTPTETLVTELAAFVGDPNNGQTLYNGALACAGCHLNAAVAPPTEGTWTRVQEVRITDPQIPGYTGDMYLAESIIHPNAYVAPGYSANVMPPNFGDRLTYQELADLIAYLKSHDEPIQ
jgi:mono/diheme cytochrome c family protein